ncbi:hypothetical protein BJ912DRAFT_1127914 [Pholiota molesta]|nr:hypothetical protein BJ912DRAFT_1127914 [Pholiota molesta]
MSVLSGEQSHSNATSWSHLRYRLPIRWEDEGNPSPGARNLPPGYGFLRWWRENQDTRSKIKINFSPWNDEVFGSDDNDDGTYSRPDYEEDDEPNFNDEEYDESRQSLNEEDDNELISIHKPILVPFHIPPTLQRLCIKYVEFELPDTSLNAFTSWSRLTHLSLHDMFMLPDVWYSLIRGLPNLQWGYFNVFLQLVDDDPEPSKFILPFLSTLSVTIDNSAGNVHDDPIGQLFRNLHLPALHDLSIYVDADPSELPHVAITINNVLRSAPTITKLTLGLEFLGFYGWRPGSDSEDIEWEGVEKISALAPHLTNLLLDMLPFWNKFLGPSHWLDLASPVNAIQKITAIVQKSSRDGPLVEAHIRGALELDEAHGEGAGGVVFEIVEEEKRDSHRAVLDGGHGAQAHFEVDLMDFKHPMSYICAL